MDNIIEYNASTDASMEERVKTEQLRESSEYIKVAGEEVPKISGYRFRILVQDKPTLEGILTREEMELIYRSYTSEGANLTQRSVSRYFSQYTFQDFKRILRAFNITKASSPLAPHIIEEASVEKLIQLTIQQKENNYLIKLEQDRQKLIESKYNDLIKEHTKLKNQYRNAEYINSEKPADFKTYVRNQNGTKTLMVYLSDMHVGAYVSEEGVYDNKYNEQEFHRRLNVVLNKIKTFDDIDNLIIFNLGDAIDGFNAQTTRPSSTHVLPQNMSNKEQGQVLIRQMTGFFNTIINEIPHNSLYFYSVGHSNHGGDFEHSIMTALGILLENMGVEVKISTRPIDHFSINNKNIIFCHGKDNLDQFKGFPLVLNDKTELYFNEYIFKNDIRGETLVIKGDLHQSATTFGKLFKYKSVGSLFGSSNWIHANFGDTRWCCDFTIIDEEGDMIDGIIKD